MPPADRPPSVAHVHATAEVFPRPPDAWPRAIRRSVDYIEARLCEPLRVQQLADAACMSRFHFSRTFRACTGQSPMEYLRRRRIGRAKELLGDGRRKVCQVASELCFFDQSHFAAAFRERCGVRPRDYARGEQVFPIPEGPKGAS